MKSINTEILKALPEAAVLIKEGKRIYANSAAEKLFNLSELFFNPEV